MLGNSFCINKPPCILYSIFICVFPFYSPRYHTWMTMIRYVDVDDDGIKSKEKETRDKTPIFYVSLSP